MERCQKKGINNNHCCLTLFVVNDTDFEQNRHVLWPCSANDRHVRWDSTKLSIDLLDLSIFPTLLVVGDTINGGWPSCASWTLSTPRWKFRSILSNGMRLHQPSGNCKFAIAACDLHPTYLSFDRWHEDSGWRWNGNMSWYPGFLFLCSRKRTGNRRLAMPA